MSKQPNGSPSAGILKYLKLSFIFLVLVGGASLTLFIRTPFKESAEVGYIQHFEREGLLFKSWEGTFVAHRPSGDSVFKFSVLNSHSDVVNAVQEAALHNKKIKAEFQEKYFRFFWQPKSTKFIIKAKFDSTSSN